MTGHLVNALFDLAAGSLAWSAEALRRGRWEWRLLAAAGLGSLVAVCAIEQAWPGVALNGALLALLLWDWWRRNGKRVKRMVGAKSRALIDELAGKVRDALRAPREVPA